MCTCYRIVSPLLTYGSARPDHAALSIVLVSNGVGVIPISETPRKRERVKIVERDVGLTARLGSEGSKQAASFLTFD